MTPRAESTASKRKSTESDLEVTLAANTGPSDKIFKVLTSQLVRIIVGPEEDTQTEFLVYENLLCARCPFFKKALQGSFKEASEKRVVLREEDPEIFSSFLYWLHAGRLVPFTEKGKEAGQDMMKYIKLWILGDRFQVTTIQNCAMDEIRAGAKKHNIYFDVPQLRHIYENTMPGATLRYNAVDFMCWHMVRRQNVDHLYRDAIHEIPGLGTDAAFSFRKLCEVDTTYGRIPMPGHLSSSYHIVDVASDKESPSKKKSRPS
ncbi:MAG: hypothetical protein M1837_003863 [Sclerophora amabilis]|nr:MAG: hypothetical protein M1837_003863 [Sclerophora amabilis]